LKGKPGDVRACTFSETDDQREVWDGIDALFVALPKTKKRKPDHVSETEDTSCSGLKQMPIQQSLQAASKSSVDHALADWVYESGIPFHIFR
jgi:hypothetical protein